MADKKAAVELEEQKSWAEQQGDNLAGMTDNLASHAQPEDDKSISQNVIDTLTQDNDAPSHVEDTGQSEPLDATPAAIVPDSKKSDSQIASDYTEEKADELGSPDEAKGAAIENFKNFLRAGKAARQS